MKVHRIIIIIFILTLLTSCNKQLEESIASDSVELRIVSSEVEDSPFFSESEADANYINGEKLERILELKNKTLDEFTNDDFAFIFSTTRDEYINVLDLNGEHIYGRLAPFASRLSVSILEVGYDRMRISIRSKEDVKYPNTSFADDKPSFIYVFPDNLPFKGVSKGLTPEEVIEVWGEGELVAVTPSHYAQYPEEVKNKPAALTYVEDGLYFTFFFTPTENDELVLVEFGVSEFVLFDE